MPWTESAIFRPWLADALAPTPGFLGKWGGPPNDLFKAALFNDTITPNKNVAAAASAYGAGVWLPAAGVSHANWPAVGRDVENTGGPTGFDPTGTVGLHRFRRRRHHRGGRRSTSPTSSATCSTTTPSPRRSRTRAPRSTTSAAPNP